MASLRMCNVFHCAFAVFPSRFLRKKKGSGAPFFSTSPWVEMKVTVTRSFSFKSLLR